MVTNYQNFWFFKTLKKGDGGFKILQKEIGGIQICVEIFQKNFWNIFLGVFRYILNKKKFRKKISIFFIFHRGGAVQETLGDPYDFILKKISLRIWKKFEIFILNFFLSKMKLRTPKNIFEKFFWKISAQIWIPPISFWRILKPPSPFWVRQTS